MLIKTEAHPIASTQRIVTLDILRGFAIFGIFVVNIEIMNCIFMHQDAFAVYWDEPIHEVVRRILQLFFYSKFFPIFSLLFGIGMALQMKGFEEKEDQKVFKSRRILGVPVFFWRRMLALFIIGVFHIVFLWGGDVLHVYAFLGLGVSFFLKKSTRLLMGIALGILIFPFYGYIVENVLGVFHLDTYIFLKEYTNDEIRALIPQGTYLEGMEFRLKEYVANTQAIFPFLMPIAMSMFLMGIAVVKKGWLYTIDSFLKKTTKGFIIVALVSNLYRIFFLFISWELPIWKIAYWRLFFIKVMEFADVLMALCMVWFVVWLLQKAFWRRVLQPLANVGKMALTNYIMQSVVGVILFTSVGFGKYETMSPTLTFFVACLTFLALVLFSAIWLRYFRFGPLEWLWRCISYWKLLPLRKAS